MSRPARKSRPERSPLYGLPGVSASTLSLDRPTAAAGPTTTTTPIPSSSSSGDQLAPHLASAEAHLGKMTLTAPDNMLRRQAQERERERRARKIVKKQARAREAMGALAGVNASTSATGATLLPLPATSASTSAHPLQTSRLPSAARSADQLHRMAAAGDAGNRRSPSPTRRGASQLTAAALPHSTSSPAVNEIASATAAARGRRSPSPRRPAAAAPAAVTSSSLQQPAQPQRPRQRQRPRPRRTTSGPAAAAVTAGNTQETASDNALAATTTTAASAAAAAVPAAVAPRASLRRHNIYSDLADMGLPGMDSSDSASEGETNTNNRAATRDHFASPDEHPPSVAAAPPITDDPPPPFPEGSTRPETPPRAPTTAEDWTSEDERRWTDYRRRIPDSPPPAFESGGEEEEVGEGEGGVQPTEAGTMPADLGATTTTEATAMVTAARTEPSASHPPPRSHSDSEVDSEVESASSSSVSSTPSLPLDEERQAWEDDARRGLSLADRIQRLELRRRRKEAAAETQLRESQVALREMMDWEERAVLESVALQSVREGRGGGGGGGDEGGAAAAVVEQGSATRRAGDAVDVQQGPVEQESTTELPSELAAQDSTARTGESDDGASAHTAPSAALPTTGEGDYQPEQQRVQPAAPAAAVRRLHQASASSNYPSAVATGLHADGALSQPSLPRIQRLDTDSRSRSRSHSSSHRATIRATRGKATSIRPRPSSESHSRFRDDASAAAERRRLAWGSAGPAVVGLDIPLAPPVQRSVSASSTPNAPILDASDSAGSAQPLSRAMPGAFASQSRAHDDAESDDAAASSSDDSEEAWAEEARQLAALRQAAERVPAVDSDDSDDDDGNDNHDALSPMGRLSVALPKAPPPLVLGRSRGGGMAYDASDSESSSDDERAGNVSDSDASLSPGEEQVVRHLNPRWEQQQQQQDEQQAQSQAAGPQLQPPVATRKSLDSARATPSAGPGPSTSVGKGKTPLRPASAGATAPQPQPQPRQPRESSRSGSTSAAAAAAGSFSSDSASSASFSAEDDEYGRNALHPHPGHSTRKTSGSSSSANSLWSSRLPGERSTAARTEVNDRLKGLFSAPLSGEASTSAAAGPSAPASAARQTQPRRRSSAKSLRSGDLFNGGDAPSGTPANESSSRSISTQRIVAGSQDGADEQQARKAALMDIARLQSALRGSAGQQQQSDSSNSLASLERILSASLRDTAGLSGSTGAPPPRHAPLPQPLARQNAVSARRPPPPVPPRGEDDETRENANPIIALGGGATVARANSFINPRSSFVPLPRQTRLPAITDATRHFPPSRTPTMTSSASSEVGDGSQLGSAASRRVAGGGGGVPGSRVSALMSRFEPNMAAAAAAESGETMGASTPFGPSRRRPPPPPPPQQQRAEVSDPPIPGALPGAAAPARPPAPPSMPSRTLSHTELARQHALDALTRNADVSTSSSSSSPVAAAAVEAPPPALPPRPQHSLLNFNRAENATRTPPPSSPATVQPAVSAPAPPAPPAPPARSSTPARRPLPQPPGPAGITSPPVTMAPSGQGAIQAAAAPPGEEQTDTTATPTAAADEASSSDSAARQAPRREGSLGITDLDILASRLEMTGSHYDDINAITEFLGPATLQNLTPSEVASVPLGLIEVEKRRVTKEGKTKMKLACLGIRVEKCGICLGQFREGQRAYVLMRCLHVFHEECGRSWFRKSRKCAICRMDVMDGDGGGGGGGSGDLIDLSA